MQGRMQNRTCTCWCCPLASLCTVLGPARMPICVGSALAQGPCQPSGPSQGSPTHMLCMRTCLGSAVCPEDGRGCFACASVRGLPYARRTGVGALHAHLSGVCRMTGGRA